MSVINQMLQDLDRRSAVSEPSADIVSPAVKPVVAERRGHEWFWRVLAVLVLISLAWVGWVAYQLQPRPLATPLAFLAAQQSTGRSTPTQDRTAETAVRLPVAAVAAEPAKSEPVAVKPQPVVQVEVMKLARSIETAIVEAPPAPAPKARATNTAAGKPSRVTSEPVPQSAAPGATAPSVDKRDLVKPANDTAEARFRRAVALLNQARISEAEEQLGAALQADPAHVGARQTYVALLLEQQRVGGALRLLREALEANPGHPGFSLALARVYAEQRDHPAALAAIDKAGAAAQSADFQALKGAVLQRMGRHAEAVTAYQEAVQKSSQPAGGTWAGLGVSLEALGRPGEAVQAYRRALAAAPLAPELRAYTEDRIRALQ